MKYKYHPSVLLILSNISEFHFSKTTIENIENEIKKIHISKTGTFKNISPKCLLENLDVSGLILLNIWNAGVLKGCPYPGKLKLANVSPAYENENPLLTKNYKNVLPRVTKMFERLMQNQLNKHINQFLSPFLCGHRTRFSTQTALLSFIERW